MLQSKLASYRERGCTVVLNTDPLAVCIVTPVMRRAHSLPQSSGVVLVDSTACCDADNHSITFMMTTCAAGAVLLAIFITPGQTAQDYIMAFSLLTGELHQEAFAGQGHPDIFITDDSEAERSALLTTWPDSTAKLCLFHVPQAVWRWLWNAQHNIRKSDRQQLMSDFQSIMRASTPESAAELYDSRMRSGLWEQYPDWQAHVEKYWDRRQLWAMAWRDHTQRGHHTNNYCEASVRLYKDVILSRCKAYNLVTLVDFTCCNLEDYYVRRLLKFAHSRTASARLVLKTELNKAAYVQSADMIQQLRDSLFTVPSSKDRTVLYTVDMSVGACECDAGRHGAFCKHQAAVMKFFHVGGPSLPPVTADARRQMAMLALGSAAKPAAFYADFCSTVETSMDQLAEAVQVPETASVDVEPSPQLGPSAVSDATVSDGSAVSSSSCLFDDAVRRLQQLHSQFGADDASAAAFLNRLRRIDSQDEWDRFLRFGARGATRFRGGSSIRVQPTSVARRRPGVTRGSKRLPVGRPPLCEGRRKRPKLTHALNTNIAYNRPNAKSHGRAH